MNRLEATIVDGSSGQIDHSGVLLQVDEARGRTRGDRVLVLITARGARADRLRERRKRPDNGVAGEVITHTFLGPVTRLR